MDSLTHSSRVGWDSDEVAKAEADLSNMTNDDITVQSCFDSDRLDLGRVGTIPDPRYLCTDAAKSPDMIAWALENSEEVWMPDNILGDLALSN